MGLKINFTDFWDGFQRDHNFFLDMFRDIYGDVQVTDSEQADILIYCGDYGGREHVRFDPKSKIKIYYTGENNRPNYDQCTYSLTFDYDDYGGRNVRLPLWFLQLDWYNKKGYTNPEFVIPINKINDNEYIQTPKTKFCVLINNNLFNDRVQCLNKLAPYKKVECYGKPFGNWFYGESKKYEIFSNFKFSICFENSVSPGGGYYTEKLIHAKCSGTIPLYYTDDKVGNDFNTKSFLNLNDYDSMDSFVEKIVELDNDKDQYESMFNEPLFNKDIGLDDLEDMKLKIKNMIGI